jgi:hypothetical protein
MSCANEICSSSVIAPAQKTDELDRPAFIRALIATIDVLQEALEMQRAADERRRFNND